MTLEEYDTIKKNYIQGIKKKNKNDGRQMIRAANNASELQKKLAARKKLKEKKKLQEKKELQVKKKKNKDPSLRPFKDFGEDEKMAAIEDLLVNPITSETLLKKYKTSVQTFRFILREKGLNPAPSDPSQMPDYPQYAERRL